MSILGNIGNAIGNAAKTVGSVLPHVSNPKPTPMTPPNRASDPSRVFQPAPMGPRPIPGPLNPLTPRPVPAPIAVPPFGSSNMPFDTKAMPKAPQPMPYNTKTQPIAPAPLANPKPAPAPYTPPKDMVFKPGPVIKPYSRQAQGPYVPAPKRPIIETLPNN
jgi:hypothetical protein